MVSFMIFYSVSEENFGSTLVCNNIAKNIQFLNKYSNDHPEVGVTNTETCKR